MTKSECFEEKEFEILKYEQKYCRTRCSITYQV
jgi:hypothetical protein